MQTETDRIYRTALVYACYGNEPSTVDENLLEKMLKDFCLLSSEYGFDYKQEFKKLLEREE